MKIFSITFNVHLNTTLDPYSSGKVSLTRLLTGSGGRVFLLCCNIAASFFLMPFIIQSLGDSLYGYWTLIATLMGYYGFLDLGLSSAITRFISKALSDRDNQGVNEIVNTSLFLFGIIGGITFLITIALYIFVPFFVDQDPRVGIFQNVLLILGISVSIGFPMRAFVGSLIGQMRYDLLSYIELVKLGLRTALVFYFLGKGYGLFALALITLCVDFVGHTLSVVCFYKEFPKIKIGKRFVLFKWAGQLFSYSKYTFISQLADLIRFRIDFFVVAAYLDLSQVTIYSIASRLNEYFIQLITSALGVLMPVFSKYEAKGDYDSIRRIFLSATKISASITFFVGTCIIFYGSYFIHVWMGAEYDASYTVLTILCLATILGLMQTPSVGLLYGLSKHKYYAVGNSCEGVLNIVFSLMLVRYYGIYGVAMGTLLEMALFKLFIQPVYSCRVIKLSLVEYYCKTLLVVFVKIVPVNMLFFYFAQKYLQYTYSSIVLYSLANCVIVIPLIWYAVFTQGERNAVYGLFFKK